MKTRKILYYTLMFLPVLIVAITMQFLSDQIPVHYNINNQVDRWGSKYEMFILPAFSVLFGFLMLGITRFAGKNEKDGVNNEKVCLLAGMISLLIFNAMTVYFLYAAFQKVENLSEVSVDVNQLTISLCGLFMIIVGNLMPKLRMNSALGLRTSWSVKNEVTWKKSQRAGGIISIVTGALFILVCCFIKGFSCTLWAAGILILSVLIMVYSTYRIAKMN